jgi:hypothetical protein
VGGLAQGGSGRRQISAEIITIDVIPAAATMGQALFHQVLMAGVLHSAAVVRGKENNETK